MSLFPPIETVLVAIKYIKKRPDYILRPSTFDDTSVLKHTPFSPGTDGLWNFINDNPNVLVWNKKQ